MVSCTETCSVMSSEVGSAPSRGVAAGPSAGAMEVRLGGQRGVSGKPIRPGVWPQPVPGRAWTGYRCQKKTLTKSEKGQGLWLKHRFQTP